MSDDPLRRALLSLLGPRPTAARRRELAALLRQLADEQEQIADADTRTGHVVRRAQIAQEAAQQRTGRPKGTGARFVRVERRHSDKPGAVVHVGRALWQELGEPARLDLQRIGATLRLTPCLPGVGYALSRPKNGMPRMTIGQDALEALRLDMRRYDARIEAGTIVAEVS
jgi:hypothetical protein